MNGNGNGNGHERPPTILGIVDGSILAAFFLQKLGKVSISQLHERIAESSKAEVIGVDLLEQCCEALRARGLASIAHGRVGGENVRMYKLRNVIWANPPEMIQLTANFLSDLIATPEATKLLAELNAAEQEGAGKVKAKERLRFTDYREVALHCKTLDEFMGGQPDSPWMRELVKLGPPAPEDCGLRFPRDPVDGMPWIPVSNIRGWFGNTMRNHNLTESVADYFFIQPARFDLKDVKIRQHQMSIVDDQGGKGLSTMEVIPPGTRFTLRLSIPVRGFMEVKDFVDFVMAVGPRSARGLSNGRSGEKGHFEVVGFEDYGESKTLSAAMAGVMDSLSEEGRKFAEGRLGKTGA